MPERPQYELKDKILEIKFPSHSHFCDYTRRALAIRATRLVAFAVTEILTNKVTCRALFNQTEPLVMDESIIDAVLSVHQH